jgi:hypothetical protein
MTRFMGALPESHGFDGFPIKAYEMGDTRRTLPRKSAISHTQTRAMKRQQIKALPLLVLLVCATAFADPIHAIADGAYWHHDSGWVFPEKIAEFVRVGIPQDVAGSHEAVAYYAREREGIRTVVAVDVYPADSEPAEATSPSALSHSFATGEWRVQIRLQAPVADPATLASLDAFVRGVTSSPILR